MLLKLFEANLHIASFCFKLQKAQGIFGKSTQRCTAAVQQILNACISHTTKDFRNFFSHL